MENLVKIKCCECDIEIEVDEEFVDCINNKCAKCEQEAREYWLQEDSRLKEIGY